MSRALQLGGQEIVATSVGGRETCIELPGWKLCFDIGRCPDTAIRRERVLLTHAHIDHAGGLATHAAMRDMLGMRPPTWYVPSANAGDIEALLATWRRLDRSDVPATVVGCDPGDRIDLGGSCAALPFRVPHRIVTQGYALVRTRQRLLPALTGAAPSEIRARRAAGLPVSEPEDRVEVAFCGDTRAEVLDREPLVAAAQVLILECTFYDARVPAELARAKGHVHLDDLVGRADRIANPHVLLTHASARYTREEILRVLDARLPRELRERVELL
jgi:ribonuclease Z